jgi:hypothetical protein
LNTYQWSFPIHTQQIYVYMVFLLQPRLSLDALALWSWFFSISHAILDFNNLKSCHFFYNFAMNPHTILIFIPKIKRTRRNCGHKFAKKKIKFLLLSLSQPFPTIINFTWTHYQLKKLFFGSKHNPPPF